MKFTGISWLFVALFFSLISTGLFGAELDGTYTVKGTGPAGTDPYSGQITLKPQGQLLAMHWDLGAGGKYTGTGMQRDNVLAAAYGGDQPYGLVVYQIANGILSGQWAIGGQEGIGVEILSGPDGLSGEYTITAAQNPAGKSYTGRVNIQPNGETYLVTWTLANESYSGIGIRHGDTLVVGWGPGQQVGAVVYEIQGNSLTGRWAAAAMKSTGSETLTK